MTIEKVLRDSEERSVAAVMKKDKSLEIGIVSSQITRKILPGHIHVLLLINSRSIGNLIGDDLQSTLLVIEMKTLHF